MINYHSSQKFSLNSRPYYYTHKYPLDCVPLKGNRNTQYNFRTISTLQTGHESHHLMTHSPTVYQQRKHDATQNKKTIKQSQTKRLYSAMHYIKLLTLKHNLTRQKNSFFWRDISMNDVVSKSHRLMPHTQDSDSSISRARGISARLKNSGELIKNSNILEKDSSPIILKKREKYYLFPRRAITDDSRKKVELFLPKML